jgi:signal transduction histidine kinase
LPYANDCTGINKKNQGRKKTLGLHSISSRVDFLGGELQLETGTGMGVEYSIYLPLN